MKRPKTYQEQLQQLNRRRQENSLERATRESMRQEDARVSRWLKLAEKMFGSDRDDDPTPSAA